MSTALICHAGAALTREGLAGWLSTFSRLKGVVLIDETRGRKLRRVRREFARSGVWGFLDVLAFRLYRKLVLDRRDAQWERALLDSLRRRFPGPRSEVLVTHSPNSAEAEAFLRRLSPDLVVARCKTLLKPSVFSIPARGTFVFHPGICPEYRNAHGCFWALARRDMGRVGMTLLKVDQGVDTGPVYGYFSCAFDEVNESHTVIQHRVVFDNLEALRATLMDIHLGVARPLDTSGRDSATWGQPKLSAYLRWKRRARKERRARADA